MPRTKKTEPNFNYNQVTDVENNAYRSIVIENKTLGVNQEWFADNLNVSKFRNGDVILHAQSKEEWRTACDNKTPAWCYFEDKKELGKLYNLYAVLDARGLAPEGFQIPNYIDFSIMGLSVQEIEPVDSAVDSISAERINDRGIASGGIKMMSKDFWKKKGKNNSGLSIIGGGWRLAAFIEFPDFEKSCHLWLRPHGMQLKVEEMKNFDVGEFSRWFDFEVLKKIFPDRDFTTSDKANLTQDEFQKILNAFSNTELKNIANLDLWYKFYADFYPIIKPEKYDNDFSTCLSELAKHITLFSSCRSGFRKAVLVSGKEQIWFTSTAGEYHISYEGYNCRPFRYVNI